MGTDPSPTPAGATLGVEEEYHLVQPGSATLMNCADLSDRALAGTAGPELRPEMLASQVEAATEVCTDLDQVRRAIVTMRRNAAAAADQVGATILATSTHPFASLSEIEVMPRPRYAGLIERFGTIVRQFNLCGCHVHVSVPDLDSAVAIMNLARPYLPVLAALTGSSPFHLGQDTRYDSFRLAWLALWPQGGPPPQLRSAEDYLATIGQSAALGLIEDASAMLWDIRPSSHYPTLEFRAADTCTDIDDALLYAGVVRSLVRVLADRVNTGSQSPTTSDQALRGARWRSARYGISELLWSPGRAELVPAAVVVADLMAELRDDLDAHGEYGVISGLLTQLQGRGTSAAWQRQRFASTGSLREVTLAAMRRTLALD
ncbi:MAG: glutamate---cysteine ligase / carboxylate-amine ligase [Pseudonocardiales bacterium]|jgi:carboxylate-amine ligase|nr:glutamate---cysteine ligase / carboxylate-amine ligase [Pseudonocardiales bacterium]